MSQVNYTRADLQRKMRDSHELHLVELVKLILPNYKKKENHPPKLLLKSHRYKVLFGLMTNA